MSFTSLSASSLCHHHPPFHVSPFLFLETGKKKNLFFFCVYECTIPLHNTLSNHCELSLVHPLTVKLVFFFFLLAHLYTPQPQENADD